MSQLQSIATRLRALAQDASPLSSNVEASARQLKSLTQQVEALGRSGINIGPLLAALVQAQTQAQAAADAAGRVKSEGVAWADQLAGGGASVATKGPGGQNGLLGALRGFLGAGSAGAGSSQLASHPELRTEMLDRLGAAKAAIERWNQQDREHARTWFGGDSDDVRRGLATRIDRIHSALDDIQLVPFEPGEGGPNVFAYVYPDATDRKIYVGELFWSRGSQPPDSRAGVLFHEMSHFNDISGTNDYAYGHENCRELTQLGPNTALGNADNFEYYIEGLS